MLFEKMNWMDVEKYLMCNDRIVLVVGSCEQHGYLSLATDTLEAYEIAKVACEKENVLCAPPVAYGINHFFNAYPGNLSLKPETLMQVVREIITSFISQGFRKIMVSNGHGGNGIPIKLVLYEIAEAHPECKLKLFQWWLDPEVDKVATDAGFKQSHANWSENHSFTRVCNVPKEEKPFFGQMDVDSSKNIREKLGDGSFGGPYQAPEDLMKRFFDTAVNAMVQELKFDK
jgi:creatinine amidohydrolase